MKMILSLLSAAMAITLALPAQAQFAKPEDAVKYRKAAFSVMATHNQRLAQMAQGKVPFDAKTALENAEVVATMAKLPWAAFPEGSDMGETKAKSEVWKQNAKFKEASDKFQSDAAKLLAAAKTGKEDAFKTAFTASSGNCKACHDDFKNK